MVKGTGKRTKDVLQQYVQKLSKNDKVHSKSPHSLGWLVEFLLNERGW